MKFPYHERHKRQVATIYEKTEQYAFYRVSWSAAGKRLLKSFVKLSDARKHAKRIVRLLAKGSAAASLNTKDASDALVARQALDDYFRVTGRQITLLRAVTGYLDADKALAGRALGEAVSHFIATSASIKRVKLADAIETFLKSREQLTIAKPGERADLSVKHHYNQGIALRDFAAVLSGSDVCDLTKELLDVYFVSRSNLAPATRNHRRAAIGQFITWAVKHEYLHAFHKLGDADSMIKQRGNQAETVFYTVEEFQALLAAADQDFLPMVVLGGLAGLRTQELLRLTWEDVWHVEGHVEIRPLAAKTQQRRLVEVCAALTSWMNPYRTMTSGAVCKLDENNFHVAFQALCKQTGIARKENGLRHGFCSYHYALHQNVNATAAQAGNSTSMIHQHYRGLATKAEGERWFNVAPSQAGNVIPMASAAQ